VETGLGTEGVGDVWEMVEDRAVTIVRYTRVMMRRRPMELIALVVGSLKPILKISMIKGYEQRMGAEVWGVSPP
jgi:hypothetical protein